MKPLHFLALTTAAMLLVGCAGQAAFGRTEDTRSAWPAFNGYTNAIIEVSVLDQRPYVLLGSKTANFVGLSRGGFGNPFDVMTSSGQSLARDLNEAVTQGLVNSGITAVVASETGAQLRSSAPTKRLLMITLKEWKSDTFTTTSFAYDLTASLYDWHGKVLANQTISGTKNITSGVDGGRRALTELLADKGIHEAIVQNGQSN